MEASVAYLLVGGAPFCDAIGLAQPDVEVAQADYTARLAGLMQQVVRALGVETGEALAWVRRLHAGWWLAHEDHRGVVLVYQLPLRLAWIGERGATQRQFALYRVRSEEHTSELQSLRHLVC